MSLKQYQVLMFDETSIKLKHSLKSKLLDCWEISGGEWHSKMGDDDT